MNQAVEAFLNEVWKEVTAIYAKESKRINELSNQSRLQAGIMDYLQVAWRKGKHTWEAGEIHIDVYEPFSWSDSSYKIEAGAYITELSDELLTEEFFPALCGLADRFHRTGYPAEVPGACGPIGLGTGSRLFESRQRKICEYL
ncbi:DUF6138 family protein [Paenibacillus sp. FSL R5-0527]|uniref:DUF6138 family protein n=1 Tax=Paenibacillus sp. FSL R5-0527 TaxID=2975321 RepID=UPI0026C946B3